MKKLALYLGLISMLTSALACRTLLPASAPGPYETLCRESLDGLNGLTAKLEFPKNFQGENPVKQGGEFDPNRYLDVLKHLSLQAGLTLDYVYSYQGIGGQPLLYARPVDQAPYLTEAEFRSAQPAGFLSAIEAEDTPEGFLQFALLSVKGPQFYLFWHANYNDDQVLCGSADIQRVIDEHSQSNFGQPFDLNQKLQARAIPDPAPRVEMTAGEARVSLLIFTNWGGFYRRTLTIQRAFPHTILNVQDETLVPYDCGIMF